MHLVDDVDFVARLHRRVLRVLDDRGAHIVDAGFGGGIHLDDIDAGALLDSAAESARFARVRRGTLLAVERLGEQARRGGFARAARAAKQVRMRLPTLLNRIPQGDRHMGLPHQLFEILRPILAVEA
jgi:hypothetical protein